MPGTRACAREALCRAAASAEAELQTQAKTVLGLLREALATGGLDADGAAFASLRETLADISRSRAIQGFTPTDTAHFVFR